MFIFANDCDVTHVVATYLKIAVLIDVIGP